MTMLYDQPLLFSVSPDAIVDYLQFGENKGNVKNYELLTALVMSDFCAIQWEKPTTISFEMNENDWNALKGSSVSGSKLAEIINERVRQDSDIDFAISSSKGSATFQVKRFGIQSTQKTGSELAFYINNQQKKYGTKKMNIRLLLFLETGTELDFREMFRQLDPKDNLFKSIMFIVQPREGILGIGEFWPNSGFDEYKIAEGHLTKI